MTVIAVGFLLSIFLILDACWAMDRDRRYAADDIDYAEGRWYWHAIHGKRRVTA